MQYFMLPAALMTASGMLANAAPLKNGNKDASSDLRPMVSPSTRAGEQLVVQWQPAAKDSAWKHMDVTLVALSEDGSQHETNLAHGIDGTDPNNNVLRAKAPEHVSGDNAEYLIKFTDGQDEKKSSKFVIRGSAKQKRHGQSSSDAPMSMDQNKMSSIIQHMLSSGGDASSLFQSQNKTSSHGHGQTGQGRSAMEQPSESNDDNDNDDEAEEDDGSSSSSSSASSSPSTSSTKSSTSTTSSDKTSTPSPTMIDGVMYFPLVSSKVPKEVLDDIKSQQSGMSSSTNSGTSKKHSKSAEPTSKPESRDAWSDIAQNMEAQQAQKAHKKISSSSSGKKKHSHKSSSSSNLSTDVGRNAAAKIPTASPSSSSSSSKKQGHGHKSSSSSSSASSNKHDHKSSSSSSKKKHSGKPSSSGSSSGSSSSSSSSSQPAESTGAASNNKAAAASNGGTNSGNGGDNQASSSGGDDQSAQSGGQGGDQGGQGGELQVDTPPFAAQCKPLRITWHGGKGPYTPHITAEGDVSNVLTTLDETSDTSVPGWKVNVPEGQKFTINLCDSDGLCKPSGPVGPVGQGSDDCMGGAGGPPQKRSASENAGGSATGSWSSPTDSERKAKSSSHSKAKKSSSQSNSRSTSKKGGRSTRSGNHNSRSSNLVPLSSVMNEANNDRASSVSLFLGMNPVAGLESLFDSSASSPGSSTNSRSSSRPSRSSASVTNSRSTPTAHHGSSQGSQSASQGSSQDVVGQLTRSINREGSHGENSSMIDMLAQGIMGDSGLSPNQVSEYFRSSGRRTSDHQRHGQMSMTVDYRHGTQSVSMSS